MVNPLSIGGQMSTENRGEATVLAGTKPAVPEFVRSLGLLDSTFMVAGTIIGSGIFLVSADIARQVGSSGWLLAVWGIGGIMTMIAALCYGELAAMMPQSGGQYVYLREAHGPLVGFLYGWTLFLVIQTGSIAAVAVAFAKYLGAVVPWVSGPIRQLVAVALIWFLTLVNLQGMRAGKRIQNTFAIAKLGALACLIVIGVFGSAPDAAIRSGAFWTPIRNGQELPWKSFLPILGIATVGAFLAYDAWNNITFTAAEVKNPRRNIPLSLSLGVGIVISVYMLVNLSYLSALPLAGIQHAPEDRVATAAVRVVLGHRAEALMAIGILVATFGSDNGMILAGSRVYYAMARDGLFFLRAGRLNRHGVPGASLIMQAVWASLLTLSGTYSDLVDYVVFAGLLFYVLTVAAVFRLRRVKRDLPRPYRTFGYPVLPALYILASVLILAALLIYKPRYTWPGLGIVLLGVPVYLLRTRRSFGRS
jgi:APA family basic amino acid/polyamine antiporter